jgi:hypothetical protein
MLPQLATGPQQRFWRAMERDPSAVTVFARYDVVMSTRRPVRTEQHPIVEARIHRRFSEAWDVFVREVDLKELRIDPEEVFAQVRDSAPGRAQRSARGQR